jgi:hypothetical protein
MTVVRAAICDHTTFIQRLLRAPSTSAALAPPHHDRKHEAFGRDACQGVESGMRLPHCLKIMLHLSFSPALQPIVTVQ